MYEWVVGEHVGHDVHVESRRQLVGVTSLLSLGGSWELNSIHHFGGNHLYFSYLGGSLVDRILEAMPK